MTLVVGLGNPGSSYSNNRHNIGFMAIESLLEKQNFKDISKTKFNGLLYKFKNTFLLKPTTFMNDSGLSVKTVVNYYDIDDIIVIYDDLDMNFASIKLKKSGGGSGGHNGIKSIDSHLKQEYIKVKLGIGRPENGLSVANWVLKDFSKEQQSCLDIILNTTSNIVDTLLVKGFENTTSLYNTKNICI